MPPGRGTKRVRRTPEKARELILEAAIRVLSKQGPDAVGLKEIASEAGVSHALVTHYFGTYEALKQATLVACLARLRTSILEQLQRAPDPTPEQLVQFYFDAALEPWYGRLVSWALLSDREGETSQAALIAEDMKRIAGATRTILSRRSRQPLTRAQAEVFVVTLWASVIGYVAGNGFFWRALDRKPGAARDREVRETLSMLARAMFDMSSSALSPR